MHFDWDAYLLKDSGEADFIAAVRAVARGEGYLSPVVSDAVLSDYRKHVTNPTDLLTTCEREVCNRWPRVRVTRRLPRPCN